MRLGLVGCLREGWEVTEEVQEPWVTRGDHSGEVSGRHVGDGSR